jgi:succinoglycan biosynthesis protein ExoV
MKIYYWNIHDNFGDLINPWLWPKLFPDIVTGELPKTKDGIEDAPDETLLVGIGTLLNERFPKCKEAYVMGSGVGYGPAPKFGDNVNVYCVRGPLSAEKLSLPTNLGIVDPGILIKNYFNQSAKKQHKISYMPQISSVVHCPGVWETACNEIGFGYMDPTHSVEETVSRIGSTEILLTESMHGAIIAEALRVPWIPIVTRPEILSFKWQDWCNSVGLDYQPIRITSLDQSNSTNILKRIRAKGLYSMAKSQLKKAAQGKAYLAKDAIVDEKIANLEDVYEKFRQDWAKK